MLGASACDEEKDGQREWVLQIDKQKPVKETDSGDGVRFLGSWRAQS